MKFKSKGLKDSTCEDLIRNDCESHLKSILYNNFNWTLTDIDSYIFSIRRSIKGC